MEKNGKKRRNSPIEIWRGLEIDRMISSGTYPSVRTFMERFGDSEATVHRDLDRLRDDFGAPIEYDRERRGYFYTRAAFRIPANLSTESQIAAARLMSNLLETVRGTPVYERAAEVFAALGTSLDGGEDDLFSRLSNRIVFLGMNPVPVSEGVWNALETALAENRYVTFEYTLHGSAPIRVTCEPWQLLYSQGMWTLYARNTEKKETRMYNLPLISNVRVSAERFTLPEDFEYEKRAVGNFRRYIGQETLRFKILITSRNTLDFIRTYRWTEDQSFEETEGGTLMTFTSNQYYPVLGWLLSHGQYATPLEPQKLVDEWKENVRGMVRNGKDGGPVA